MYNGKLVTFSIKDKDYLICKSLLDVDIRIDDVGIMLINKSTQTDLGYICNVVGIEFEEMMSIFGYTLEDKNV